MSDFRQADILGGGHGAPIMPAVESVIHGGDDKNRAFLNIGGIANVNIPSKKLGFDIGPGNCLIDLAAQKLFKIPFDAEGHLAKIGKVNHKVLGFCVKLFDS